MKTLMLITVTACLSSCMSENKNSEDTAMATTETVATDNTETSVAEEKKKPTLADIKIGMKDERVRAILGKPDKTDVLNPELGQRIEDWWYGNNQKIRMTGGQVTLVIKDHAKQQETLTKLGEARANGDDAEVSRLMEEAKSLSGGM